MSNTTIALSPSKFSRMVIQYQKGATAQELAQRYGMSPSTVLNKLRAAGVAIRSRGRRSSN